MIYRFLVYFLCCYFWGGFIFDALCRLNFKVPLGDRKRKWICSFLLDGRRNCIGKLGKINHCLTQEKRMKREGRLKNRVFPEAKYMIHSIYFRRNLMHLLEKVMIN